MELFDPDIHLARSVQTYREHPGAADSLPLARAVRGNPGITLIPRPEDCSALWDSYAMLDNIRAHSAKVAELAHAMALAARGRGMAVNPDAVLASGLLHDLAKTYTIAHGGSHAQLGAAWVMRETRNAPVAQAVLFHVHWPWRERVDDDALFLVFSIVYADKRVKHDAYVGLDERFDDLVERYGVSDAVRARIALSLQQGKRIETALSRRLEVPLHEYIADHGRLVKRA
jgi:putative nucleotidyltransferase with HDIG domain